MNERDERRYQAYLLRLWQETDEQQWRAMVENAHTGEQMGFPDIPSLLAFLLDQTVDRTGQPASGDNRQ